MSVNISQQPNIAVSYLKYLEMRYSNQTLSTDSPDNLTSNQIMNFTAIGADATDTSCVFTDFNVGPTKVSKVVFKKCRQLCVIILDRLTEYSLIMGHHSFYYGKSQHRSAFLGG